MVQKKKKEKKGFKTSLNKPKVWNFLSVKPLWKLVKSICISWNFLLEWKRRFKAELAGKSVLEKSQIFRSISDGNNNPFSFFLAAEGHSSNPGFSRKSRSRDTGISPPVRDLTSSRTSPTTASSTGAQTLREWRKPGNSCWNGSPSCAGNAAQPGASLNNNS